MSNSVWSALAVWLLTTINLVALEALVPADWSKWRAKRLESVAGTNGWTTLVGRSWLAEGTNFVGAAPTNQAVLSASRAPAMVGAFIRSGRTVRFEAAPGIETMVDGKPERSAAMQSDLNGNPTRLLVGPLSFVIIERGDRIGLRVRDPEASARKQFAGLKYYPYDPAWRLQGRFEPFPEPRIMRVADVSGGTQEHQSPGELAFTFDRQTFRLQVIEEPGEDDYFVIFRDQTAGSSTYESGRFLYVAKPHADGLVIADFNRAYTPPCGFTAFTTCPLPPRQNWLPFSIRAGELRPENHPQE